MYLVNVLHKTMKMSYAGEPGDEVVDELAIAQDAQEQDNHHNMDFLGPDLDAGLGPLLRFQLDQKRAVEQEARRIARERALLEEFDRNEDELRELIQQMGRAVDARHKRKCTLEYLKCTVAETKNLLLNIQGLNTTHSGRRCQR